MIRSKWGMTSERVQANLHAYQATADRQADLWIRRQLRAYFDDLERAAFSIPYTPRVRTYDPAFAPRANR